MSKETNRISEGVINLVVEAAKIEEVVGDFVELTKKGPRYLGLCPFHDDRKIGSFVVYPRKNCYKCFSCNAHGGPVSFLEQHLGIGFLDAIRWLGRKYAIPIDDVQLDVTTPAPRQKPEPLPTLYLPFSMVTDKEHDINNNTLCKWIYHLPWSNEQKKRVIPTFKAYHLGHTNFGHTIFWQIDEKGKVRTGKMMLYKKDGHRNKKARWNFDFVHAMLFRDPKKPEYSDSKQDLKQTLFGMHLLDKYGHNADVCIVESEKTAVLMAIAYGNNDRHIWMACGGLENLSPERLAPIIERHRKITLYPDRDGIDRWKQKAEQLNYDRLTIDAKPVMSEAEGGLWSEADGPKADIADVIIRRLLNKKV